MMNRMALESFANSGRRASVGSHVRNGGGGKFNTGGDGDDGLDLFSKTTRRSDGDHIRLDKIAVGPGRIGRGMEDLLDCEIGKHDYDWLLTPPETPLYPSAVARENPLSSNSLSREGPLYSTVPPAIARESPVSSTGPRGRATARSVSNTRPSRLSTSQTESSHPTRPVRSSSVTRPSISSSYSTSFSNNNNKTSMLNTSSSSITSSRPSTPNSRLTKPSLNSTTTTRPSSSSTSIRPSSSSTISRPSSSSTISRISSNSSSNARSSSNTRPVNSRPPTPTKVRPNPSSTSATRPVNSRLPTPTRTRPNPSSTSSTRTANNSRPSTPNSSRPPTPSNSNSNSNSNVVSRVNSRPSTPTRRPTSSGGPSASTAASRISGVNRVPPASTRNPSGSGSRPSSPGPRPRAPVRPIDLPDFPTDAPPNLRTKLPDRPASAGRTRPGMALTLRSNSNTDATVPSSVSAASNRRNYAPPVVSRGRFSENQPKGGSAKLHGSSNGHDVASDNGGVRRHAKSASVTESTGFGRNISKKSLDMALRHMDIRQGMGGLRASSLFPQSIRSTSTKTQPVRKSDPIVPLSHDEYIHDSHSYSGTNSPDCRSSIAFSENGDFAPGSIKSPDRESLATTRDSEFDLLHGSTRYDAFMLKEDSKNMNWLHSAEDKSNQSPVFDHRFEPLPEPFDLQ